MSNVEQGTRENPVVKMGDYYTILETLMSEGKSVYFALTELLLYLDVEANKLKLVEVRWSLDREKILSAIAQTMALAQRYNLWPEASDELLLARYSPSPDLKS